MIAKGKAIGYVMREGKMGSLVGTNLLDSRLPGEIIKEFEMVNGNHERCKNKYLRFEIGIAPGDEKKMSGEIQPCKTPCKLYLAPIGADKTGQVVIDTDSVSEIYVICGIFIA